MTQRDQLPCLKFSKAKKEQRNAHIGKAGLILKRAHDEKRDMTPEETKEFEDLHKMADDLLKQIELLMKQSDAEADVGSDEEAASERLARPHMEKRDRSPADKAELRDRAFKKYVRGHSLTGAEYRALTIGGSGTGAEMVPNGIHQGFYEVLRTTGSIRQGNPVVETPSSGNATNYPVYNDTANEGEIITAGGTATTTADPATSKMTLGGYNFSSKVFSLGRDYVQDVSHDAVAAVQKMAVDRLAVHQDRKMTVGAGSGSNEPQGMVTGSSLGKTAAATTAVTFTEILDLINSLAPQYREGAYLFLTDTTLLAVKKLTDADGNSIWWHGAAGNAANPFPPTIAGVKYITCPYMPAMTAGLKPICYANLSQGYRIHDVQASELLVDPYTNGRKYMVDYCWFTRFDAGVFNSSAIKHMIMAAS